MLKAAYNFLVGRRIIKEAAAVILVTGAERPQCEAYGVAPEKMLVIPNGIDLEWPGDLDPGEFREKSGVGRDPFLLFLGRLNRIKGPDLLIQAFGETLAELPAYRLVLAGPDEGLGRELAETAARCGAGDRIHFTGYLDRTAKAQALHAADLVVIPSRQEAMSIVVLEAGSAATPVLLTDPCGVAEVAAINGGEVVPATVAGLKAGLVRMLQAPERLTAQGRNLQRFVREHFAWDVIVGRYLALYQRLLGEFRAA